MTAAKFKLDAIRALERLHADKSYSTCAGCKRAIRDCINDISALPVDEVEPSADLATGDAAVCPDVESGRRSVESRIAAAVVAIHSATLEPKYYYSAEGNVQLAIALHAEFEKQMEEKA